MLNFKFIRLGWFFVLAFVLFFHNISLALEQQAGAGSLRSLVIKDVKIETSDTEVKISGKLINQSQNIATSKITHLLVLETIDPLIKPKNEIDQMPPLIVLAEEGKDYFSLNPNKQKSFSYSLSASKYVPKANYRLSLSFIRSDGKEEASHSEVIINFGSSEKEGFLAFDQQSCVLFSKEGKRLGNNNGPAFLPGESPKISCLIKNIGDKEIEVSPKILWKEVFVYGKPLEGKMTEEKQSEKIFFNPGESKTIALFMPIAEKPQTYQGLLSFEDENGASRSFNTFFRWTISGESARVKSVAQTNQLKDFYDKGDVVLLSVDYFGSSDLYWAGTQAVSNLSDLTMRAVIKDKNGNICGEKEETLPEIIDGFSKNKTVEVVLDKKCKGMTYSVSLSSGQKSLTEQSGDLPKFINRQNTLQYFYFGTPAIMILLAFYLFIRKKSVPVYFFIFAFAGVAMFSVSVLAETKTFPESGGTVHPWEWGGDWINDGSVVLYSTAHGTGGLNKLRPDKINAQLSGFFINNNDIGSVDVDYFTDDTSCSNTSMEVEYKVLIIADGLGETPLTTKRVTYNANTGYQHEYVSIPPTNIQSLYDNSGIPRKNPKLIVEMKQIGMYGEEEFNYEYKWVGLDLGSYGYNQETEAYYPESGGGYDLVTTANETFYPGLFSSGASDKRTKANAYASSDTIKIEVPLSLPTPTLRLKPLSATINPGQTKQFSVFYDADGPSSGFPEENVTAKIGARGIDNWSSDDATVVKVNEAGLATAVASGSAKIKAIYYRGLNAKVQISVPSFRIRPMKAEITEGYGRQFESLYDEDGWGVFFDEKKITDQSVWISDNPDSATVENKKNILGGKGKGWVSALKKGSANISADYSGLRAVSYVLVKDIPIPLDVSCSVDKNPVLVNEQTAIFTATAVGGTEPYSYSWTGDDGLVGITDTIRKSYSATGTKNAIIEVKDKTTTASDSCSVEVNDGTVGECNTVKDQCLIGVLDDITDSATQYLWNCVGTKSTESCSLDKPKPPAYYIDPTFVELEVGDSYQFDGWYDGNGEGVFEKIVSSEASWESSISSVASVDKGKAFCTKEGQVKITSRYNEITAEPSAVLNCAKYPVKEYTLTVKKIGDGYVSSGVDCGASCSKAQIPLNTKTALHAEAFQGYLFGSFSVVDIDDNGIRTASDCDEEYIDEETKNNICDLVINSNKEVTVVFEKDPIYSISPKMTTIKIGEKFQFKGEWLDGEHYPQDKTNVAEWKVVDELGNEDDTVATFKSVGLKTGEAKCISVETAYIHSTYGGKEDTAELVCNNTSHAEYLLTVKKIGDGYGEITGDVECDIGCDSVVSEKFTEGSVVEITATSLEGSSFGGWSEDCSSFDKRDTCELTITKDKTVTVSFVEDVPPEIAAYISAEDTEVKYEEKTTVSWMSDNAVRCVGEGGGSDTGWVGNKGTKGFYSTKSFGKGEERNYAVTCYNNVGESDSDSVVVSSDSDEPLIPTVDLIADPDEVEFKGITTLSWLSENTKAGSCFINNEKVEDNSSKITDALNIESHKYFYTIKCEGDDGSFVEDEVVVETKEKEVICENNCGTGKIDITSNADTITAIIVAGLTAKSEKTEINVSSNDCEGSTADLDFKYKNGGGPGKAFIGEDSLPMTEVTLGKIGDFFIKKIDGKTDAGTYVIELTAKCFDKDEKELTGIKIINLIIKSILSDWQEF